MSDDEKQASGALAEERKRDEILRRLLNTPPQPRPKRERGDKDTKPKEKRKPAKKN